MHPGYIPMHSGCCNPMHEGYNPATLRTQVRRLAPVTLLLLLAACAAVPVLGWRYASKRKGD